MNGREQLLSATVKSTVRLLRCSDLTQAIPELLAHLGTAADVDRMQLLQMEREGLGIRLSHIDSWCAPGIAPASNLEGLVGCDVLAAGFGEWVSLAMNGMIVAGSVKNFDAHNRTILEADHVKSIISVPILIGDEWWGCLAFHSCRAERHWGSGEIDILKMLVEVLGAAIQRDRTQAALADANRIIESSTTILFRLVRPGTDDYLLHYISSNISRYGYTSTELLAEPTRWLSLVDGLDAPHITDAINAVASGRVAKVDAEFRLICPDGSRVWFYGQASATLEPLTKLAAIEGIVTDVTEHKRASLEIERLASVDVVTGLANRTTFMRRLRQACKSAHESQGAVAVHYIDLDGFKTVNDSYGHIVGDELLKAVGKRIANAIRGDDTAARLGGDEFAVLQSDLPSFAEAQATAQRICDVICGHPFRIGNLHVNITASVGIDCRAGSEADGESLLAGADTALYRAKAEGRNCVRVHGGGPDGSTPASRSISVA